MKLRTTLLLVVLNAVVFFFLLRQESPFDLRTRMGSTEAGILNRPMSEVVGIRVDGQTLERPYHLILEQGRWRIQEPVQWDANAFAVRSMISQMEAAEVSVRFPVSDIQSRQQSLADFGLEDPHLVVHLDYGDEVRTFAFGAPVEINDQLYLLGPDRQEIWVVRSSLVQPFLIELSDLRSSSLFSIPVFEVRSLLVEFTDDGSRRRFTRDESGWVMDTPFFAEANTERVQGAIHRLVNHEVDASTLVPGEGVQQQEVTHFNAIARFEVIGNRRNSTLLVSRYLVNGEAHPALYLARFEGAATTFLLPRAEIDWWRTSQSSLRERHFLNLNPAAISKVELVSGSQEPRTLRLLRLENDQWRIYAGPSTVDLVDFLADGPTVVEILTELNDLIALEFVNDDPSTSDLDTYGLAEPSLTVSLEGDQTQRLLIGATAEQPQRSYAKLAASNSVYLVANEVLSRLRLDPLHYRNRSIELLPGGESLAAAEILNRQTGHVTDLRSVQALQETAIQPLSSEDAEGVIAALQVMLRHFRADGFLDASVSDGILHYGGVEMKLVFEMKLWSDASADPASSIWLTRRLSGSEQYAWIAEQDLVVKLPQSLVDVLHPLLFVTELPEEWEPPVTLSDEDSVSEEPAEMEVNPEQARESANPMPEEVGEIE